MEKNKKRARRRHDRQTHFIKRLEVFKRKTGYIDYPETEDTLNKEDRQSLLEHFKWLTVFKTTGTPCSCDICSYEKYDRKKSKTELKDEIENWEKEISEMTEEEFNDILNKKDDIRQ